MAQMIILGIVQGLTEFLPISSSAHLVFAEHYLGISRPGLVLEAVLHLGTATSAIVLFWPDMRRLLWGLVTSVRAPRMTWQGNPNAYGRLAWMILVATAITGIIGLVFLESFERMFTSARGAAAQLMLTGVILVLARQRGRRGMLETRLADAAAIGLAQGISIVPGISRSGITIATALWAGLAQEEAARLSFLVSIPALIGAGLFALRDANHAGALGYSAVHLLVGFAVAAVTGAIAIRWLLGVVRRGRLAAFAIYCWAAGLAVLLSTWR